MSITIENKAGAADKFKGAQSIPGGSKFFTKCGRAFKEVVGKVGKHFKDNKGTYLTLGAAAVCGVCVVAALNNPVNADANAYGEIAKHGANLYWSKLGQIALAGVSGLSALSAIAADGVAALRGDESKIAKFLSNVSKKLGNLQGKILKTANVQAKANTGR